MKLRELIRRWLGIDRLEERLSTKEGLVIEHRMDPQDLNTIIDQITYRMTIKSANRIEELVGEYTGSEQFLDEIIARILRKQLKS
mgnify:CR=1 FL=1|jgi:hypothetical protein